MGNNTADLTIVIPTYNKEKYISETLDSVFSQRTKYSYNIIVTDDCSTDSTLAIVSLYQKKYPGKISVLESTENLKLYKNVIRAYKLLNSKYWCVLDPDDYWIDKEHIQKALDFLESHKEFTIYGTDITVLKPSGIKENCSFSTKSRDSSWEDYLNGKAIIPFTQSCVYRNVIFIRGLPKYLQNPVSDTQTRSFRGDSFRNAIHIQQGKAHYVPESHAVYRITSEGIWQSMNELQQHLLNCAFYKDLWLYFDKNYPNLLLKSFLVYHKNILPNLVSDLMSMPSDDKRINCLQELWDLQNIYQDNINLIRECLYKTLSVKKRLLYKIYKRLFRKFGFNGGL